MEIAITNNTNEKNWNEYLTDFENIFSKTLRILGKSDNYIISIIFCNDQEIQAINRDYRKIDKVTDVISFASLDEDIDYQMINDEVELGDIFININRVKSQATEYQHSLRREVCFLFTHGLLHTLGYDHMEANDEKVMFALQDRILDGLVNRND